MDKTELERKNEQYYNTCSNYMHVAHTLAQRAEERVIKVGCLFVKHGNIIAFGYNAKEPTLENPFGSAELNAVCKLAVSTETSLDSTVFLTHAPSRETAKLLIRCKVREVIFDEWGEVNDGITLLHDNGISIEPLYKLKPNYYHE